MNNLLEKTNKKNDQSRSIFLHTFKNFSTTSSRTSFKIQINIALFIILMFLIVGYIVVEFLIVFNIIQNKSEISLRNDLDIKSAKIEKSYNQKIASLTLDYALANGFVKVGIDHFANRLDDASSLSLLYDGER